MNTRLIALGAATVLVYAAGYPLGALALQGLSPFWLIALRFVLTAALLWPAVLLRGLALPARGAWLPAVLAGLLVQGAQFLGAYWAMAHGVGAGVTALVVALNPALTALLSVAVTRRGIGASAWFSVALAAAAAVAAACLPRILADPAVGPGVLGALVGLLGLAGGSLIQGRALGGVHPLAFTAIGVSVSSPLALGLALATPGRVSTAPGAWVLLVLLTLCGLAGTTLYAATVRAFGARTASLQFALIPAVPSVLSWPLVGEAPGVPTGVGLALGAGAVVLQLRGNARVGARDAPREIRTSTEDRRIADLRSFSGSRTASCTGAGSLESQHRVGAHAPTGAP